MKEKFEGSLRRGSEPESKAGKLQTGLKSTQHNHLVRPYAIGLTEVPPQKVLVVSEKDEWQGSAHIIAKYRAQNSQASNIVRDKLKLGSGEARHVE